MNSKKFRKEGKQNAIKNSEPRGAEEALQHAAQEWRATFDSIADMVSMHDKDYKIIKMNKAFTDRLKMKPQEVVGRTCYELIHGTKEPLPLCPHKQVLEMKKAAKAEFFEPHLDIYIKASASPVFNEKNEVVRTVHIIEDITERKKTEEELNGALREAIKSREIMVSMLDDNNQIREELEKNLVELKKAQNQLIQTEKLAVVGQLAAGVAHEINNPLSVVSVEAEMLLRDENKDKDTKDTSKIIVEQSKRIKEIVERLLEFSRKKEFKTEPLGINEIVAKSISLLSYQTKIENIEIIKKLDSDLPKVTGNNSQIQEVFLNIMLNAVQAMEGKGKLTIRTSSEKIKAFGRRKSDKFKVGAELVAVEFEDTGSGMDEETLKKVFDPFYSTKEKGTGLGLSICYRIIENHHGSIEARSKIGKGSTFIVRLPVKRRGGG